MYTRDVLAVGSRLGLTCLPSLFLLPSFAIGATSTASTASSACVLATFVGGGEPTTDASCDDAFTG